MSKKMASILVIYGAMIGALSLLLNIDRLRAATFPVFTGLASAAFTIAWGIAAGIRPRTRTWPILILVAASVVFLMNAVNLWWGFFEKDVPLLPLALASSCLLLTFGVLCYLLYAERPPSYWTGRNPGASNSQPPPSTRSR